MSLQFISPDVNIDFVGKRYFFVAVSTAINLAAIFLLIFVGLNYGVDFAGGSIVQVKFSQATDGNHVRAALAPLGLGDITVQDFGNVGHDYLIRFAKVHHIPNLGSALSDTLKKAGYQAKVQRVETVGAKVGSDLRTRRDRSAGLRHDPDGPLYRVPLPARRAGASARVR